MTQRPIDKFSSAPTATSRRWPRILLASTTALALVAPDLASAVCKDGSSFPAGGYVVGINPPTAANWSPNVFTDAAGSLFIPDNSTNEGNTAAGSPTHGGHNWVFDQGSTLCKQTDIGSAGGMPTAWAIPPNTFPDCVVLPVFPGADVAEIPYQGDVITPTCNPDLLSTATAPNPNNSYFNQLGCAISHGVRTTPKTATSYLFVAGMRSGLFSVSLANAPKVPGGEAGKTAGLIDFYAVIPLGQKLTNAAVSKDGQFAIATSIKHLQPVYACLNPLGDPGDITQPIDMNFVVPVARTVACMQVGSNNLTTDRTTAFGPDNQPYFGGRPVVNSFDTVPGGASHSAWPNCIWQNGPATSLADAFARKVENGCGAAQPNVAFSAARVAQPQALAVHGRYMYTGSIGGTIVQFKVTIDPVFKVSRYRFRTYATGLPPNTGIGIADDLQSLMVFGTPPLVVGPGTGDVTRLPLCEDM